MGEGALLLPRRLLDVEPEAAEGFAELIFAITGR